MRKSLLSRIPTALLLLAVALLVSSCGWSMWDSPMTTVRPKSDFGRLTNQIFMLISWWTLGIGIVVEAGLLWVCFRFREKPGQPIPTQVHGHTLLEVSWTIAFAVILLIFAVPTIPVIFETQAAPPPTASQVHRFTVARSPPKATRVRPSAGTSVAGRATVAQVTGLRGTPLHSCGLVRRS